MHTLREKMSDADAFLWGIELVSTRGTMDQQQTVRVREFASRLVDHGHVDWVSITDNAGGNPMLSPMALGKPILYGGRVTRL